MKHAIWIVAVFVVLASLWFMGCASGRDVSGQEVADPENRLQTLGLTLPGPNVPIGTYRSAVRSGDFVFLAGHVECEDPLVGKVGADITLEDAYASARDVGLCLLATLKEEIGDLRKVKRIVRVFGMVNATPDYTDHPKVINGCSDMLVEVFGERGRHARSAVGVASLPGGMAVEIEMMVEVED